MRWYGKFNGDVPCDVFHQCEVFCANWLTTSLDISDVNTNPNYPFLMVPSSCFPDDFRGFRGFSVEFPGILRGFGEKRVIAIVFRIRTSRHQWTMKPLPFAVVLSMEWISVDLACQIFKPVAHTVSSFQETLELLLSLAIDNITHWPPATLPSVVSPSSLPRPTRSTVRLIVETYLV